jgi:uncharacterized protein
VANPIHEKYTAKNIYQLNMEIGKIIQIAEKAMRDRREDQKREKGFIFFHGLRTAKLALNLKQKLKTNCNFSDDVLFAGALFHDIGKGTEPHNQTGAEMAKNCLSGYCSENELRDICDIIFSHNRRNELDGLSNEIKLVQDADILDHFGSLEIWLKFLYSAHNNENISDALNFWQSKEFNNYQKICRNLLNFEISKQIFDEKNFFQNEFSKRLTIEANGEII